jgi:choline-sulfatase
MARWQIQIALAVAVAAVALVSCSSGDEAPSRANVLLVTLDTTRVEMLGSYGGPGRTPYLDEFAARSQRFEQAITTAPYTGPSHASILTGLLPPRHGLRDYLRQALPEPATTLAEVLGAAGFDTAAFVSTYVLDESYGLDQGFDVYSATARAPNGKQKFRRNGPETVDEAIAWLGARDSRRPWFLWLHLYDAHSRAIGGMARGYRAPVAYRGELPAGVSESSVEGVRQRYYEQAGVLDGEVERLLETTRALGLSNRTIVAVTADHGELLGAHGRRLVGHSTSLADATIRVPLLLYVPGGPAGAVRPEQVSVVDLFPTVLDALGLEIPAGLDGSSLIDASGEPRFAYSETLYADFPKRAAEGEELVSIRRGRWKLLARPDRVSLFNLRSDPAELRDLAAEHPDVVAELQAVIEEVRNRGSAVQEDHAGSASEEHVENLRALGYVK